MQISTTLTFPQQLQVERLVLEDGVVIVHVSAQSSVHRGTCSSYNGGTGKIEWLDQPPAHLLC